MTQASLPVEKARPLIEIPEFVPQAGFLGGKQGKEINREIQSKYEDFPALQRTSYDDSVVKGSNPFYVVAVNEFLRQNGINARTATQADLERTQKTGALDLRGHYEDSALVLRNENNPNSYLARDLTRQIKERTGKDRKTPIMIPLTGLELRTDQDSEHGLAFNLTDDSEIIYSPQLAHKNNHKKFSETNDKGLPIFDKDGNRTLYTRDSGLSRVYLYGDLGLGAGYDGLADSGVIGRVVVVSGEATSRENLKNGFMEQIQSAYDSQLQELESRRDEAEKAVDDIMSGKK